MPIAKYPAGSSKVLRTIEPVNGLFTVDCSSATDFYLNLNNSYYSEYKTLSYVGGKTVSIAGTSNDYTVSLTDLSGGTNTSPQTGDVVIVAAAFGFNTNQVYNISAYTQIADLFVNNDGGSTSSDTNLFVGYKVMGPTPDTSVTFVGGSFDDRVAISVAVHVWRNANPNSPIDITSVTNITAISNISPPFSPITPVTPGAQIVAIAGGNHNKNPATLPVYTSSLSNFLSSAANDSDSDSIIGIGSFSWTSGTYTATTWGSTLDSPATNTSSASVVLALRPDFKRNAEVDLTNIPSTYKEISILGNVLTSSVGSRQFTWDSSIVRVSNPASALFPGQSFYYNFVLQDGVPYLKEILGSSKIQKTEYIKSTQNWVCPGDVTEIEIILCGGGGGGSSGTGESPGAGSVINDFLYVIPGTTYLVTIGAGGVGAINSASTTVGGTSSFGSDLFIAGGGRGTNTFSVPAGKGGFGLDPDISSDVGRELSGFSGYGLGGSRRLDIPGLANSGNGGNSATNGGSGVAILKYWTTA